MSTERDIIELQTRVGMLEEDWRRRGEHIPVVFDIKCNKCGVIVAHLSHLATDIRPKDHSIRAASTTMVGVYDMRIAIKTCLNCGEITWRD